MAGPMRKARNAGVRACRAEVYYVAQLNDAALAELRENFRETLRNERPGSETAG
jgi:hypothetical protein